MSVFSQMPRTKVRSNSFNLSHDVKMSFDLGKLVPFCQLEVLPGDKFKIDAKAFMRFQPLLAPVMHKLNVDIRFFYVPNRIIFPEWEDFISGNEDIEWPYLEMSTQQLDGALGTFADYMGLPAGTQGFTPEETDTFKVNALPFAAYNRIWNEYYRDQNLQTANNNFEVRADECQPGANVALSVSALSALPNKAWEHDYFTSNLPFAQKGEAVQLPIFDGDVEVLQDHSKWSGTDDPAFRKVSDGNYPFTVDTPPARRDIQQSQTDDSIRYDQGAGTEQGTLYYDPQGTLYVDGQQQAVTINTFRRAVVLQQWLEKNARGGTRYTELVESHFGVKNADARLQRPEYLGGFRSNMQISEVLSQTETLNSSNETVNPVGQYAGHGVGFAQGNRKINHYCPEHGWILGVLSVIPKTAYFQGIPRKYYTRQDRLDYYWPSFAHIGEQETLNQEVYLETDNAIFDSNLETFGYLPRYSEYRYEPSRVAGDFRTTLRFWHFSRYFENQPNLNSEFVRSVPTSDPFAVVSDEFNKILSHVFCDVKATRKMPRFGAPGIKMI